MCILQLYAVLCVISQYQELMAGRGTARFEQTLRVNTQFYNLFINLYTNILLNLLYLV